MKKILVLDNYDSFTYNLVHYLELLSDENTNITVFRNDEITLDEVAQYDKILLSPGPGLPEEAGILLALIKRYAPSKSILGVCLGHQAIAESFGGSLNNLAEVYHGIATPITIAETDQLFQHIPQNFQGGRYHSWVVDAKSLPDCLQVTAYDNNGEIMALRHKSYDLRGVQFHPESVLTEHGKTLIANWLAAN